MARHSLVRVVLGGMLLLSLALIAAATLTPGGTPPEAGAASRFWCLACGPVGGADASANIVLFLPLGVSLALLGVRPSRAALIGALVSMAVETAQGLGYPPLRVASAGDIITNATGTLLGAVAARHWGRWVLPSPRTAGRVAMLGVAAVCSILAFAAWALGPAGSGTQVTALTPSSLPFTPGFGWFHGRITGIEVNGAPFPHNGDGPAILRGRLGASVRGTLEIAGRDERDGLVPILFVHDSGSVVPQLMLAQRGADLQLRRELRGAALHLPGPSLTLAGAFSSTASAAQTLAFGVAPAGWSLSKVRHPETQRAELALSVGLGWTLFQTAVDTDSPLAPILTAVWMFLLSLPVGYWCTLADEGLPARTRNHGRRSGLGLLLGTAVLAGALWMIPRVAGIAGCSPAEWAFAVCGLACGVLFAAQVLGNRARLEALWHDTRRQSPGHERTFTSH